MFLTINDITHLYFVTSGNIKLFVRVVNNAKKIAFQTIIVLNITEKNEPISVSKQNKMQSQTTFYLERHTSSAHYHSCNYNSHIYYMSTSLRVAKQHTSQYKCQFS